MAATDWDGDGFEDLVVGAPLADAAAPNAGAVFVFSGGADTFSRDLVTGDAAVRVPGESAEDLLGWSVAGVTLPGGAGLVVGAPGRDGPAGTRAAPWSSRAPPIRAPARRPTPCT